MDVAEKANETTKEISSPTSTFSNTTTKAKNLKKVAAALPSSPRKKVEVVKSLAKKFNLKVQYSNQIKTGRPSNALTEAEID